MSLPPEDKAKTPENFATLKITKPHKNSVGFGGIKAAVSQVIKYMNPANALKLSLKINQKGGFDCPGCAWYQIQTMNALN
ncbi:hypothetical protein [Thalassobellus suaedae]|uniref:Uncharacterized protein n=1 Tax=Thalassobellus suaedae TaxID=3074124 RepID=A0ABY9XYI0_9FLAO|nr:hypothetical protein RHP51_09705 [Flavobacteriaceae bacterium HL-DH14]